MSKGSTSKTLVWILMAMLILGLGGFGVTNLSGTVRTLATVGDKEITLNGYARALEQELRALEAQTGQSIGFIDAQNAGLDRVVLRNLVTTRAMDAEISRMGISLGDENLRQELLEIPAFQSPSGDFDREAYRYSMEQAGLSESDFEASIREDTVRPLLQAAVLSGVTMPASYAETILGYVGEERDVTLARVSTDILATPIATPDEAALKAYYDENTANYMLPATRDIAYAWLSPDMLIDDVEIDETTLRETYDARDSEYNRAERRLVERLAFVDDAAAQNAVDRMNSGQASFETLVDERGLQLGDVDLGDVSQNELGGAAGEAVFTAPVGATVGPVQSDLGAAIFRINGILPAQSTSFEKALPLLREELAGERARRVIETQIGDIDDLLAAGATLEELASETDMQFDTLAWHPEATNTIAAYEAFRTTAALVTDRDFPQVEVLADGGIFALRLQGDTEARPAAFEDIRDTVLADWTTAETVRRLQEIADTLAPQLVGDTAFEAFGLTARNEAGILRNGFVADVPNTFLAEIFGMDMGKVMVITGPDMVILAKLDAVRAPDLNNPEVMNLRQAILQQASQGLSQDLFETYADQLQTIQPVTVNQQALNAVHAQFQ